MVYVLDCAFCAALFLPNDHSGEVKAVFNKIGEDDEVIAPVLWWQEMSAVLATAVDRKRLTPAEALEINRLLSAYNFSVDLNYGGEYTEKLLELSLAYGINANNAAYLELGLRRKARMGSLSRELRTACGKAGLQLV
jgi:predicted nucleic acid-binding protein